jgi:hypothetical protein
MLDGGVHDIAGAMTSTTDAVGPIRRGLLREDVPCQFQMNEPTGLVKVVLCRNRPAGRIPRLCAAQCQRMGQIPNRKQGETHDRTPEIDIMTEAMRKSPLHPRKQLESLRHMGNDDH